MLQPKYMKMFLAEAEQIASKYALKSTGGLQHTVNTEKGAYSQQVSKLWPEQKSTSYSIYKAMEDKKILPEVTTVNNIPSGEVIRNINTKNGEIIGNLSGASTASIDILNLPNKLEEVKKAKGIGSAIKKSFKAGLSAALLSAVAISSPLLTSKAMIAFDQHALAKTAMNYTEEISIKDATLAQKLAYASDKNPLIKDKDLFVSELLEIDKLPDVKFSSEINNKLANNMNLTPEERKEWLATNNQFTLDIYKSKDENRFINRILNLDRAIDENGNLDEKFIEGITRFAPNFSKKHGLGEYIEATEGGKLESVSEDLQAIYNKAVSYNKNNAKISVTEGKRSASYQHKIYQANRLDVNGNYVDPEGQPFTFADGYISRSDHQAGNAIDVHIPGKAQDRKTGANRVYGNFNKDMQRAYRELGFDQKYTLDWGGTYVNDDFGHFGLLEKNKQDVKIPVTKSRSYEEAKEEILKSYTIPNGNLMGTQFYQAKSTFLQQVFDRKIAPKLGLTKKDKAVASMFQETIGSNIPDIINFHQDAKNNWQIFNSQITNLTKSKNLAFRNRGDNSPISTENGIILTTFENFARPQDVHYKSTGTSRTPITLTDDRGIIGVTDQGELIAGSFGEYKNRTDIMISPMPYQKMTTLVKDAEGNQVYRNKEGFLPSAFFPEVRYLDNGEEKIGTFNFVVGDRDATKYGNSDGGRILMKNPDTKQIYLVSGSFQEVSQAFDLIKGDSKYLDTWTLDNGTYVRGLNTHTGDISAIQLASYDALNLGGGGNGIYISKGNK